MTLSLEFKAAAFSIRDLEDKVAESMAAKKGHDEVKSDSKEVKSDDVDGDDPDTVLPSDFAMDIDPEEALSVEAVLRKMEMTLYRLCAALKTKEEFVDCMKMLKVVVSNMVRNPLDSVSAKGTLSVFQCLSV